ncbi:hypothetical protein I0P70_20070 [Pontibacter sp. FD36]|uniref:hypothetical protein n=1 Tax=Pontibacter sp. FD36 TaxID=2789860 RepID=UPI0018ABE09E|nr:hypothetical protein [Pontibacter sp. FD36]MBF8965558.1 hypothetical protein [Pontibacter sp. FD36]
MARDYQDDYGRGSYRSHDRDRSQHEEGGFFNRIGEKISHAWERIAGDEDDRGERQQRGSTHHPYSGEFDRGGYRSSGYGSGTSGSQGQRYGQSQMGRYSPQRSQGSSYRSGQSESSSGYSGRMSDYGSSSQGSSYGRTGSPYGAGSSGGEYGASEHTGYGSSQRDYGSSSGYGESSGGYGRSSMGFPRGSDYGSGGSGSMGGGYFGSGAGPWSGGPYGDTGNVGYRSRSGSQRDSVQGFQGRNSSMGSTGGYGSSEGYSRSDYDYSRREQRRRGQSDQNFGSDWDR